MKRSDRLGRFLAGIALLLILLIMLARSRSAPAPEAQQVAVSDTPPRAGPPPRPAPPPPAPASAAGGTPTLDLLARLEAHRRVTRAGSTVYLDSLLAESDSLLRRWPGGRDAPITIAFVEDEVASEVPFGSAVVREAFGAWEALSLGVSFNVIRDTAAAKVVVRWIPRFAPEEKRAGQTAIEFDRNGVIRRGAIRLAVTGPDGRKFDRAEALTIAVHEAGHALGLAHSSDSRDVMYATPLTGRLSDRDRRTVELIYGLPAGSVKGGDN